MSTYKSCFRRLRWHCCQPRPPIQNSRHLSNCGTSGARSNRNHSRRKETGWKFDRRGLKLSTLRAEPRRGKFRIILITSRTTPERSTMSLRFGYYRSRRRFPLVLSVYLLVWRPLVADANRSSLWCSRTFAVARTRFLVKVENTSGTVNSAQIVFTVLENFTGDFGRTQKLQRDV